MIHRKNCGMELFTGDMLGDSLEDNLETASFDGKNWSNPKHGGGSISGRFIKCRRRCPAHPKPSAGPTTYRDLRLYL